MKRALLNSYKSYLKNESGIAALMGALVVIVIVAIAAINFCKETEQKYPGAALTYTSTNAFLLPMGVGALLLPSRMTIAI
ncbi:MAG: hypothetical protein VYC17_04970 [Nitrospinota bacterium]|nr:hypothetical protein [Nitrospinota bacterium]